MSTWPTDAELAAMPAEVRNQVLDNISQEAHDLAEWQADERRHKDEQDANG